MFIYVHASMASEPATTAVSDAGLVAVVPAVASGPGLGPAVEESMFKIRVRSILFGVGPSGCGKTHLFKNVVIPRLTQDLEEPLGMIMAPNVKYLSSEDIRRWL